jgi:hypothetical protein
MPSDQMSTRNEYGRPRIISGASLRARSRHVRKRDVIACGAREQTHTTLSATARTLTTHTSAPCRRTSCVAVRRTPNTWWRNRNRPVSPAQCVHRLPCCARKPSTHLAVAAQQHVVALDVAMYAILAGGDDGWSATSITCTHATTSDL